MPTKLSDLLERENQAGNQEDGQFSGASGRQKNQAFDDIARNSEQEDFNDIMDRNLDHDSPLRTDSHGDTVNKNYNADNPSRNIDDVKNNEQSNLYNGSGANQPGSKGSIKGRFAGKIKGKGASFGVAALLAGSFTAISTLLIPGALLVMLEKGLTNFSAESTRTDQTLQRAYVGGIFGVSKGATDLEKKMTGITEAEKTAWEKNKFTLEVEKVDDKPTYKIKSAQYEGRGQKFSDPDSFLKFVDGNIKARQSFNRVVNIRADSFNKSPKFNKILAKYNLNKSNVLKSSREKQKEARKAAIDKSFNENVGAVEGDREARIRSLRASTLDSPELKTKLGKIADSVRKRSGGVDVVTIPVSIMCAGYSAVKVTNATVKAKLYLDLIRFGFPFFQAASQIQDQGNIEPEVVENLADRLTWYQSPTYTQKLADAESDPAEKAMILEKENLTAMDAQGIKQALYGDFSGLMESAKQYTTGWVAAGVVGSKTASEIEKIFPGGREGIRNACAVNSYVALAGAAGCATPVTAILCAAAFAATIAIVAEFGDDILKKIVEELGDGAVERIADMNLDANLRGVDLGNALAATMGLLMMQKNMGSGLLAATNVGQIESFISATDDVYYKYGEELVKEDAKENQFDASNQYTFMGQVAVALNPYRAENSTAYSSFANLISTTFSPLQLLSTSANALYSQPSQMTARQGSAAGITGNCKDEDMELIGALCANPGRMVGQTSMEVINKAKGQSTASNDATLDTIKYMRANEYIEESGKPTGEEQTGANDDTKEKKFNYMKFKKYCTSDRVDPIGTTSESLLEGTAEDQDWFTYERCLGKDPADKEMFDNFVYYYNMCEIQIPIAKGVENCWSEATVAATPAVKNTGDWVIPTSGPCLSPFGPRWGTQHAGIDLSPPSGTPIVAPTSMKITSVGDLSDQYGTSVIGTATDGSNYSFRFAHMIAGSPSVTVGQEVAKGQTIGQVGSTGDVTGPHLHFEIYPSGTNAMSYSGATDPVPVLAEHGVAASC